MAVRVGLVRACMVVVLLALACRLSQAQEPDALAQAAPCREAAERSRAGVAGATSPALYKEVLAGLQVMIDAFVEKHGVDDESSLHCLNAYGATLLHLGERAAAAGVYRRGTAGGR